MSLLSAVLGRWWVQLGILAVLDVGDEVVQWLGAGAHHEAGDQQVAPERRLSGAVGADGLIRVTGEYHLPGEIPAA